MKRILIVDDDTDLLITLKSFLLKKGFKVVTSTTCSEGLTILQSISPHLVLLDINVGNEDGRTMCRHIKNESDLKHIPVIMISANHQELERFQEYGANSYIYKPFDLKILLNKIEETIAPL